MYNSICRASRTLSQTYDRCGYTQESLSLNFCGRDWLDANRPYARSLRYTPGSGYARLMQTGLFVTNNYYSNDDLCSYILLRKHSYVLLWLTHKYVCINLQSILDTVMVNQLRSFKYYLRLYTCTFWDLDLRRFWLGKITWYYIVSALVSAGGLVTCTIILMFITNNITYVILLK